MLVLKPEGFFKFQDTGFNWMMRIFVLPRFQNKQRVCNFSTCFSILSATFLNSNFFFDYHNFYFLPATMKYSTGCVYVCVFVCLTPPPQCSGGALNSHRKHRISPKTHWKRYFYSGRASGGIPWLPVAFRWILVSTGIIQYLTGILPVRSFFPPEE